VIHDYDHIRTLIEKTLPEFNGFNQHIKQPGGFYLGNSAAERRWLTTTSKANFIAHELPEDIISQSQRGLTDNKIFLLQTLRSHDQYNTTIYGFEDRYRGISGERTVLMMNSEDIASLGFKAGQLVDIEALWPDGRERKVTGFRLVPFDIPKGNTASYFPEANPLVALSSYGDNSFTPTSKSVAIVVTAAQTTAPLVTTKNV